MPTNNVYKGVCQKLGGGHRNLLIQKYSSLQTITGNGNMMGVGRPSNHKQAGPLHGESITFTFRPPTLWRTLFRRKSFPGYVVPPLVVSQQFQADPRFDGSARKVAPMRKKRFQSQAATSNEAQSLTYAGAIETYFKECSFALLVVLLLIALSPCRADTGLMNNPTAIRGPLEVRLAYTDQNGTAQDYPLQNVPSAVFNALPSGLQQVATSKIAQSQATPNSYFDQWWANNRQNVCDDVSGQVQQFINNNQNRAYNLNCSTSAQGILSANIENQWYDEASGTQQVGQRLVLDYYVPLNNVVFTVTSPSTCQSGGLLGVCPQDPQFTAIFDVHIRVISTSPDPTTLRLPLIDSWAGQVTVVNVVAGDFGKAVFDASVSFAGDELSGGAFDPVSAAKFLVQLGEIYAAGFGNGQIPNNGLGSLADVISGDLTYIGSSTAGNGARQASSDFANLYAGLAGGYPVGFRQFDISVGSDDSLVFRLTYPAPPAPAVYNAVTILNNSNSFANASIKVNPSQATAGQQVTVTGSGFQGTYTTRAEIGWTRTVIGPPTTEISWTSAAQSGQASTSQTDFEISTTPNTRYRFSVHECDPITCSPWAQFTLTTQAAGSDQVTLWLDASSAPSGLAGLLTTPQPNAVGTIMPDGTFSANLTIPPGTAPGKHTITAEATGPTGPESPSVPFTVCAAGGCGPAMEVVQKTVVATLPVTIDFFDFPAGQVNVYVDSTTGIPLVGSPFTISSTSTCPSCNGTVEHTFILSDLSAADHTLWAVEPLPDGQTLKVSLSVSVMRLAQ